MTKPRTKKREGVPALPMGTPVDTLPAYGFLESPAFTRRVYDYLSEDEYAVFQWQLAAAPDAGDVIPGTGGIRKIRWPDPRRKKGKRGGTRVIYFIFFEERQLYLLTIYDKNEMDDLTSGEKKVLKKLVDDEVVARAEKRRKARAE